MLHIKKLCSKHDKLEEFCTLFNLKSLINKENSFSNNRKSIIDWILTNKLNYFQKSSIIETGVSDHHKLVGTFFKSHFNMLLPKTVYYRSHKNFDQDSFLNNLQKKNFELK